MATIAKTPEYFTGRFLEKIEIRKTTIRTVFTAREEPTAAETEISVLFQNLTKETVELTVQYKDGRYKGRSFRLTIAGETSISHPVYLNTHVQLIRSQPAAAPSPAPSTLPIVADVASEPSAAPADQIASPAPSPARSAEGAAVSPPPSPEREGPSSLPSSPVAPRRWFSGLRGALSWIASPITALFTMLGRLVGLIKY